jgi:hypothetical protein
MNYSKSKTTKVSSYFFLQQKQTSCYSPMKPERKQVANETRRKQIKTSGQNETSNERTNETSNEKSNERQNETSNEKSNETQNENQLSLDA